MASTAPWPGARVVGMAVGDHGALRPGAPDRYGSRRACSTAPAGTGIRMSCGRILGIWGCVRIHSSLLPPTLAANLAFDPVVDSNDARTFVPVLRRSDGRPPVRFCARSAAQGRSCRRRRSVCCRRPNLRPASPPPGSRSGKFANGSASANRRSRRFAKRATRIPTIATARACA